MPSELAVPLLPVPLASSITLSNTFVAPGPIPRTLMVALRPSRTAAPAQSASCTFTGRFWPWVTSLVPATTGDTNVTATALTTVTCCWQDAVFPEASRTTQVTTVVPSGRVAGASFVSGTLLVPDNGQFS